MDGNVMIVDFSVYDRGKVKGILSNIGKFQITEVESQEQYYKIIGTLGYLSLIIMDIASPLENAGFELLSNIRSIPGYKNIPVIVTSRLDSPEAKKKALALSVRDYIIKPYSPNRLESSIRSFINKKSKFTFDPSGVESIHMTFEQYFAKELRLSSRIQQPLSLMLVIYSALEDAAGDSSGGQAIHEKALEQASSTIRQTIRATDTVLPDYGKRIIIAVLPATRASGARTITERISDRLDILCREWDLPFTDCFVSVCATYPDEGENLNELMERTYKKADEVEMYRRTAEVSPETRERARKTYNRFRFWF